MNTNNATISAPPRVATPEERPATSQIKRTLRTSTSEGMAYGAFLGLGDHYIMAYAVALQTSSFQIGLLAAVPGLVASLAQLSDTRLVEVLKSRKAVILTFAALQGLMFLPLLGLALADLPQESWLLLTCVTLYAIFGAMVGPAWGSLMSEVVPARMRGRYFAARGRMATLANLAAFMVAGVFLSALAHRAMWGFAILFGLAVGARLVSWLLLRRLREVPRRRVEVRGRPATAAQNLPAASLNRYLLFLFAMAFAVNLASPYFTVYQLRDLKMSYLVYAALDTVSSVATLVAISYWGRAADQVGNRKTLLVAVFCIPLVPLLWLASANLLYLGVVQMVSGLAWAGFNLCTVNYLFDATTPANRVRYLAYFNAGQGLAAGMGALLGGFLASRVPPLLGYSILTLFLVSGLLRMAVAAAFWSSIKEVRKVSNLPAAQLFHVLTGGRPVGHRHGSHHWRFHPRHHESA